MYGCLLILISVIDLELYENIIRVDRKSKHFWLLWIYLYDYLPIVYLLLECRVKWHML